jgi:hypothetical protein
VVWSVMWNLVCRLGGQSYDVWETDGEENIRSVKRGCKRNVGKVTQKGATQLVHFTLHEVKEDETCASW